MRSNRPPRGPPRTVLALLTTTLLSSHVTAITLDQFQQIAGFPGFCSSAYLKPVQGCQESDFNPPDAPCSQACFDGLNAATTYINSQCKGVSADPTTLIGLFFEGKGAAALCPSVTPNGGGNSNPAPIIIPPQPNPNQASNAPQQTSETFIMTSMAGAEPTNVGGSGGGNLASPMANPTNGANGAGGVMAGTQTAVQPSATGKNNGGGNGNGDSGSFGGGAVPFGVSQSAQGAANALSPASAISLGGLLLAAVLL